jgi:hypothetical protein
VAHHHQPWEAATMKSKLTVAQPKATTGRDRTISESDFKNPDGSLLGIYLGEVAALLTLLDDLHCEALEIDYSKIPEAMGLTKDGVVHSLTGRTIEAAARELTKAREALHDLFREVELKPKAVA